MARLLMMMQLCVLFMILLFRKWLQWELQWHLKKRGKHWSFFLQYVCNLILTAVSSSLPYNVLGLAWQILDNSTLGQKFQELIANDTELKSNKHAHCVTTCWNSDFDCLAAHLHFKNIIQSLTGASENKLKSYCLSDDLWDLVDDDQEVLLVWFILHIQFRVYLMKI